MGERDETLDRFYRKQAIIAAAPSQADCMMLMCDCETECKREAARREITAINAEHPTPPEED